MKTNIRSLRPLSRFVIASFFVPKPLFIWKKTCSTCRDARRFVESTAGLSAVEERELNAAPMTTEELDLLIGQHDYKLFLNTRNELYRKLNMKERPPTRAEAVKLMAREPNLIKRPLLVRGQNVVYGFDEDEFKALLSKRS